MTWVKTIRTIWTILILVSCNNTSNSKMADNKTDNPFTKTNLTNNKSAPIITDNNINKWNLYRIGLLFWWFYLSGLIKIIETDQEIEIIGQADNGDTALNKIL